MQDLMLQTKCLRAQIKKKGYNICAFTPPLTAQDHNETNQQKVSAL